MTTIPYLEEQLNQTNKDLKYFQNKSQRQVKEIQRLNKELKEKKDIINKFIADENGGVSYTLQIENERLNNIIDELEKWSKENNVNYRDIYGYEMEDTKVIYLEDFIDKLKELKEGK